MHTWRFVAIVLVLVLLAGCETVAPGVSPLAVPQDGELPPAEIPASVELSGPGIAAIVSLIVSLALMYVPSFNAWWSEFIYKRETLAATGFVVALALVGLHYLGAIDLALGAFGWPVIWRVLSVWLAYAGTGQLIYTGKRSLAG
ncbi:MAG: hypothetical protein M0R37_11870 [Bacteroidales bacterium]|jgi:hypothetical protein|nr:hypothetical protein [Bacteroidales bacterium]